MTAHKHPISPAASDTLTNSVRSGTTGAVPGSPAGAAPNLSEIEGARGSRRNVSATCPTDPDLGNAGEPDGKDEWVTAGETASVSKPWGNQPVCPKCNRGATYNCVCGEWIADEEMMPAADVVRIMRDFFPETGWGLAERSALGMGAKQ